MLDHSERAPDVLPALVAGKAGLRRCFAFPFKCSPAQMQTPGRADIFHRSPCNQVRVVKLSLAKLDAMQRHGDYGDTVAQEIALKLVDRLSQHASQNVRRRP